MDLNIILEARKEAVQVMTESVKRAINEFTEKTSIGPDAIELRVVRDIYPLSGQSTVERIEMKITL